LPMDLCSAGMDLAVEDMVARAEACGQLWVGRVGVGWGGVGWGGVGTGRVSGAQVRGQDRSKAHLVPA